jgi:hypothetical protein
MELLPVEESACYRCRSPRIGEIEPFTGAENARGGSRPSCRDAGSRKVDVSEIGARPRIR